MNGSEIKEFRRRYNLTQEQLAIIAECSLRAVQSWEQNNRNISKSALKLIQLYEGSMLKEKETGGNHFRGDGNSYINVGSGTLSQNAKETNSEMYVKRIAELEEENKELRHKIDQLTADLLKSKERIINLLERE